MAVLKYNTADGGTNGVAVTTANSGGASGDAWGNVTGGTGVWTYSNTQTVKGGLAYQCAQAAGTAAILQLNFATAQTAHYGRAYAYLTNFATGEHPVVRGYNSSFGDAWRIALTSTGQMRIRDAAAATLSTTSGSITTGAWWRFEWRVVSGSGTSGQITVNAYAGDATTPSLTYTNNACNTGTPTNYIFFGPSLSSPQVPTLYLDEMVTDDVGYVGPANVVNQPPVANAGSDQSVIEGSIVTLDGTGSNDSDGTIAAYAWSQTGGTGVSLSSASVARPTFTAPTGPATLTFVLTVTDNSGATATDSVLISVSSALFRLNTATGGSNGATVTTANSGGAAGNAWSAVSGGGAWTFSTTNPARGTMGYQCTQTAGVSATLQWDVTTLSTIYGRIYVYFTGYPSATQIMVRTFDTGFANECWRVDLTAAGKLQVRDGTTALLATSTATLVPGGFYRLEWHWVAGTTTGTIEFKAFTADQTTPLFNYSNTAVNAGTEMSHIQFGPGYGTVTLPTIYMDELALNAAGWIGTAPGTLLNSPPTANAGPDQSVGMNTTVTLNGSTSSDVDGTVTAYAWSQTGGTAVTLSSSSVAKPTFTAPGSSTTLTFVLTVTDNSGATATDSVIVTVLPTILFQNSAEGGTPNGSVTAANSGGASGTAWQSVNGGGAWTYATAHTARGTVAYQCDQNTSTAAVLQAQLSAVTEHYGRVYFYFQGFALATDSVVRAFASGFVEAFRIEINTGHKLVVCDGGGVSRHSSTNALVAGAWYRLEWHVVSSATVGQIETRLYIADQSTPDDSFSSAASLNTRAETSWVQMGPSFGLNPAAPRKWFDEVVIGMAAGSWIGSAPGTPINQAPIANAGTDATAEPHTVYGLQGLATDDGTIVTWTWRQISGTPVVLSATTAQNPTFVVPAVQGGDTLVFGLTVTDDGGLSSAEDTVTVTVLTPTRFFARGGAWVG